MSSILEPAKANKIDYTPGANIQSSYRIEPSQIGSWSTNPPLWRRDDDWELLMSREVNYWNDMLGFYREWKIGGDVPQPYAVKFNEMGKGTRMILDIRLERCQKLIGHPEAWKVTWIEEVLGKLDEAKWLFLPLVFIGLLSLLFTPLWASLPLIVLSGAVATFRMQKIMTYRRRLNEQLEQLKLSEASAAAQANA
jgi:hypothetical protein